MYKTYLNAADFGAKGSRESVGARAVLGSCEITVERIADFEVGDSVLLSGGGSRFVSKVFFERRDTSPVNPRKLKYCVPLEDRIEMEGELSGDWLVYMIDCCPEEPQIFRWTKDYGRNWHTLPMQQGFIDLDGMARVKINDFPELAYGSTSVFVFSDRLVTEITAIDGNTVTLAVPAEKSGECTLLHSDTAALQNAIDTAIADRKNLFIPNGTYRLTSTLNVVNPRSLKIFGESADGTVFDNSLGSVGVERQDGAAFSIVGGSELSLEDMSMYGNTGFKDRDICGNLRPAGSGSVWGFYFRKTNAIQVHNTERVYVKNCHAWRMSAECFYARSDYRKSDGAPEQYPYSIIYDRCSVVDCARNAFNNNDMAEGTALINCRIVDVGGCSWEGASRFVKISGCYFRNAGSVALGNVRHRTADLERLPTGQHIITNNYFESNVPYGRAMIRIGSFATQVVISNNVFTNFNSGAIDFFSEGNYQDSPPENVIISSNSIDMTAVDSPSKPRTAIKITSGFITVADNHISVRGERDDNMTGILISDDATRVNIHNNMICGAGTGIRTVRASGRVGIVEGDRRFYRMEGRIGEEIKPMLPRRLSHRYRGWSLRFADGSECRIREFDAETKCFVLQEPKELHTGDEFIIYPTEAMPTVIRANMLEDCGVATELDTEGGRRAHLVDNLIY